MSPLPASKQWQLEPERTIIVNMHGAGTEGGDEENHINRHIEAPSASSLQSYPSSSYENPDSANGDKRKRNRTDELASAACDQCRSRKVRCDRLQPVCSNCERTGARCSSSSSKRVNHTKQLRDDFSIVVDRLNDVDRNIGVLINLTQHIASRSACDHTGHGKLSTTQDTSCRNLLDDDNHQDNDAGSSLRNEAVSPELRHDSNNNNPGEGSEIDDEDQEPGIHYHRCDGAFELENLGERMYGYPSSLTLIKSMSNKLAHGLDDDKHNSTNALDANGHDILCRTPTRNTACGLGQPEELQTAPQNTLGGQEPVDIPPEVRRHLLRGFPFTGISDATAVQTDQKPITSPPEMLVNIFMETFLRTYNTRFPIFDEPSLRQAIYMHYQCVDVATGQKDDTGAGTDPRPPQSRSCGEGEKIHGKTSNYSCWALIFSNIVVLGLGLETQLGRAPGAHSPAIGNVWNDDLVPSLLQNSNRALRNLREFSHPSLLHVKTLLVLSLTAQEFYSKNMFGDVCQRACQIGRLMGLHCSNMTSDHEGSAMERERVFRVLYSMEKQRALILGQPCELFAFDWDVQQRRRAQRNRQISQLASDLTPVRQINSAFDDMMRIWEEIYLGLCCSRALASGPKNAKREVARISKLMDDWSHEHASAMCASSQAPHIGTTSTSPVPATATSTTETWFSNIQVLQDSAKNDLRPLKIELRYCYHVTRVLCLRHHLRNSHAQRQLCSHARACLELINEIATAPLNVTKLATLGRIFGNYPIVSFVDLITCHIQTSKPPSPRGNISAADQQQHSIQAMSHVTNVGQSLFSDGDARVDFELLKSLPRHIQLLQRPAFPSTYFNWLQAGLCWTTQIIDAYMQFRLCLQPQPNISIRQNVLDKNASSLELIQPAIAYQSSAISEGSSEPHTQICPPGSVSATAEWSDISSMTDMNHLQQQPLLYAPRRYHQQPQPLGDDVEDEFLSAPQRQRFAAEHMADDGKGLDMMGLANCGFYPTIGSEAPPRPSLSDEAPSRSSVHVSHTSPRQAASGTKNAPTALESHNDYAFQEVDDFEDFYEQGSWHVDRVRR